MRPQHSIRSGGWLATAILVIAGLVGGVASPALADGAGPSGLVHPIDRLPVPPPPAVSAPSWIIYDADLDMVISEQDADLRLPMASTTKIMTGLLAFELAEPGQTVVVSQRAADIGEAEIGLVAGEELTVLSLTRSLLVRSANDASMAVAEALGGSVEGFVELMNARAAELGLANTSFANPHGLDEEDHYSTARDLLDLGIAAMNNPDFATAVGLNRYRISDDPEGLPRIATTTNVLLGDYPGMSGVKTGFTNRAGLVFVASATRQGRTLYTVVMGSQGERGHFVDAARLLDHGFDMGIVPAIRDGLPFRTTIEARQVDIDRRITASLEALVHVAPLGPLGTATVAAEEASIVTVVEPDTPGLATSLRWWFGGSG